MSCSPGILKPDLQGNSIIKSRYGQMSSDDTGKIDRHMSKGAYRPLFVDCVPDIDAGEIGRHML